MTQSGNDHRSAARLDVRITVVLKDRTFDGAMYFFSRNVSSTGIFIESNLFLQEGVIVRLQFLLPGSDFAVDAVGRVIRVESRMEPQEGIVPGLGIEFLEITDEEKAQIETFASDK